MILPIYIYGQPVLRKVAQDIDENYPELQKLIEDMFETLDASGGIGLAAPQIGKSIRVVIIDLTPLSDEFPEYKDFRHAFINGHILEFDDSETETLEEGCLSLLGEPRPTVRFQTVRVKFEDEHHRPQTKTYSGFTAQIIQHEVDHCNGILI